MATSDTGYCKVTISLPCSLVEYADRMARARSISRSQVIGQALKRQEKAERDALAVEGYIRTSAENEEFARSVAASVSDWLEVEDWGQ